MEKLIFFNEDRCFFHLKNKKISYIIELLDNSYLSHLYFGKKVDSYNFSNKLKLKKRTFSANPIIEKPEFSLDLLPQEFSTPNNSDFRNSSIKIENSHCELITRFKYVNYEIINAPLSLENLPYVRDNEKLSQTLLINLYDKISNVTLKLFYTIFEDSSVIVRSSKIVNNGETAIKIKKIASASIDIPYDNQICTSFYGTHQKEFQLNQSSIQHGKFTIGTTRGASGPQYPPFIAISDNKSEFSGKVYSMSLLYSGNHEETIERDQYNQLRIQTGINEEDFNWELQKNEYFQTPQALLVFTDEGFNGLSSEYHSFIKNHIIHPIWRNKKRPLLINSWEMSYFDVSEDIIIKLIDDAKNLGFEAVVLDDGWYGKRNNSKSSLGDWNVDKTKFPNGIKYLVEYAKQNNMKFGIWFEPEMVSPNTELIKKHPEWTMRSENYEPTLGRNQYFLDLTNNNVQKFIIDTISNAIEDYGIEYIKWDMNRHITDPFSTINQLKNTDYTHNYILSLYNILNKLTKKYPHVLFENCSSGGGRLDLGMLFYFPQTWISDNTDGLDRQQIQYGASYIFPISSITGHVSDVPNHQTGRVTPFKTRAALASSTNMGYEMNIIDITTEEKKMITHHLYEYKEERDLILNGIFYRLSSPFSTNISAWMFVNENKTQSIIHIFRNIYNVFELSFIIRIPYLDLSAMYIVEKTNQIFSGEELANCGLTIENKPEDFKNYKIKIRKIENK